MQTKTIYALVDPRTEKVRYVGCTEDVDRRLAEHIRGKQCSGPDVIAWNNELESVG